MFSLTFPCARCRCRRRRRHGAVLLLAGGGGARRRTGGQGGPGLVWSGLVWAGAGPKVLAVSGRGGLGTPRLYPYCAARCRRGPAPPPLPARAHARPPGRGLSLPHASTPGHSHAKHRTPHLPHTPPSHLTTPSPPFLPSPPPRLLSNSLHFSVPILATPISLPGPTRAPCCVSCWRAAATSARCWAAAARGRAGRCTRWCPTPRSAGACSRA